MQKDYTYDQQAAAAHVTYDQNFINVNPKYNFTQGHVKARPLIILFIDDFKAKLFRSFKSSSAGALCLIEITKDYDSTLLHLFSNAAIF